MKHFVNESLDLKELGHLCYEFVDLLCFVQLVIQAKHEQVNFSYKKIPMYTIQVCENIDFKKLVHVLFCQIGDDSHYCPLNVE